MARARAYKEYQQLRLSEATIPLEIHHEWRQSARVSISKNKAIVRLPIMVAEATKTEHLNWAKEWILKKIHKDQSLLHHFIPKKYESGDEINVRGTTFYLQVDESPERKSALGKRKQNILYLLLPSGLTVHQKQQTCSQLIHRIMSNTYAHHVKRRVDELNDLYFNKEINEIRLRNNSSNWGSCSSNKNISISSRLLLAPPFVLDYIIIHELAHLIHHNHSKAYWQLVERIMPDYMLAEDWLKKHGTSCQW